jgi:hypothetical protein
MWVNAGNGAIIAKDFDQPVGVNGRFWRLLWCAILPSFNYVNLISILQFNTVNHSRQVLYWQI